ncbi:MAG: hypothetical protein AB7K52_07190 [Phycisphaerales bacterium]
MRNLDDAVVLEFRERAKRSGTSVEGLLRQLLIDEAGRPRREWAERLRQQHDRFRAEHGELPDSTPGIRAERDGLE